MAQHRLDPLLRPASIAVVGASARAGTVGAQVLANLLEGGYSGDLYPVNPNYEALAGVKCYPELASLPAPPEHVIFGVGDERLEALLDEALAAGVKAVTLLSTLILDDEARAASAFGTTLRERVTRKLDDAGTLACGANAMGFFNFRDGIWAAGFDTRRHTSPGNVALISQSGSGMCGIVDCESRIDFNLAVSTGQELTVGLEDYLDFALDLPETRVVGLFLETCRRPQALRAAFEKANRKRIPLVAIKTGRTACAAALTVSHAGALAGSDAAFDALFDRYGVQRVRDMDELATALILFAQMRDLGPGALVALHDSGGERQLLVDLADECGVPLTTLTEATKNELDALLDPGLMAVNPLDGWSRGGPGAGKAMTKMLAVLLGDPGAALAALVHDRAPEGAIYPEYIEYLKYAHAATGKPLALVASRQGPGSDPLVVATTKELGLPIVDGVTSFLSAVRCLFGYRDFQRRSQAVPRRETAALAATWRERLLRGGQPDEVESLAMLRAFGLPASEAWVVKNIEDALRLWQRLDAPVVLKTVTAGVAHKSDVGGVKLALNDARAIRSAYADLAERFGDAVLVAPMAPAGVEMLLGVHRDPNFGPLVVIGGGGIHAETLNDVAHALPPFDAATARRLLDGLRTRALLDGQRGAPPGDVDALCEAAARFSQMAYALGDAVREADVNPLIVHGSGCVAVDALIVPAERQRSAEARRFA